jgi:probable F420-dependent oxidoreductase
VTPQVSIYLPTYSAHDPGGWQHLMRRARIADEVGIDRVAVTDHVVFGEALDAYGNPAVGGRTGGRQPTGPDGHWLEPLMVLSHLAAVTSRVRLGTTILIAGLRRPVVLAKQLSTLDVLSGGRVDVGVGVGWQREEYVAAGLDFEGRGRLLDHTLDVCRALWTQPIAEFHDELLDFSAIHQMPKPLQAGGPPIWVSGTFNRRSMDRLARFGSGWIPWGPAAADLPTYIPLVRDALAARGRADAGKLQIMGDVSFAAGADGRLDRARVADVVGPLVEAGVTDLRVAIAIADDESAQRDLLHSLVENIRSIA